MPTTETFWNQMGAYNEDRIVFATGLYGLVLLVKNWKIIGRSHRNEQKFII
jgi:hypothetical protein